MFLLMKYQIRQDRDTHSRKIVIEVACNVLVDIPFYLLSIPIFLTLWRAPILVKAMQAVCVFSTSLLNLFSQEKYNYRRITVLIQLYEWIVDIPFVLMTLLLLITLLRSYSTYCILVIEIFVYYSCFRNQELI